MNFDSTMFLVLGISILFNVILVSYWLERTNRAARKAWWVFRAKK